MTDTEMLARRLSCELLGHEVAEAEDNSTALVAGITVVCNTCWRQYYDSNNYVVLPWTREVLLPFARALDPTFVER